MTKMAQPRTNIPSQETDTAGRVRAALAAAGLFSMSVNLLMLTVPLYMLQVFDRVLTSRSP